MPDEDIIRRVALDHLVIAARTLDEGSDYVAQTLGVGMEPGGKHGAMGTHNRLLRLSSRAYLEVIAIDPDAQRPQVPRWFALDGPAMQDRLARGPLLVTWLVRVDDAAAAARAVPVLGNVRAMQRGEYDWQLTVRFDGALPYDGVLPSLISWRSGGHPAAVLPDRNLRLERLSGTHPRSAEVRAKLAALHAAELIEIGDGEPSLVATIFGTPSGPVDLH